MNTTFSELNTHLNELLSGESRTTICLEYIPPIKLLKHLTTLDPNVIILGSNINDEDKYFEYYLSYLDNELIFKGSWFYGDYTITLASLL